VPQHFVKQQRVRQQAVPAQHAALTQRPIFLYLNLWGGFWGCGFFGFFGFF